MDIHFRNSRMREACEDYKELCIKYGNQQAKQIVTRIYELKAAVNLYDIKQLPQARLHPLKGNLSGLFAVDLYKGLRMILKPLDGEIADYKSITSIEIREIGDYH